MFTLQGPELHLDAPDQQETVLLLDLSTPQGSEQHQDETTPQGPELGLVVHITGA